MRTSLRSSLLIGLVLTLLSPAFAADKEFDAFWIKFKAALQKNDKAAICAMTKLPYKLDSHDLNRQQFIQKYNLVFPASVRKCLLKEKPVQDRDAWMVFCGEEFYYFSKTNGKYLFTEIGIND